MSLGIIGINFSYVVSAGLFVFGLKMLSSPATARRGNLLSALGMLVAIVATLLASGLALKWIIIGVAIGPRDIVREGVNGSLDENLRCAALRALKVSRVSCLEFASHYSWDVCTREFLNNLVPN